MLAQTCSQIGADSGSNKLLAEKMNGTSGGSVSPKGQLSTNLTSGSNGTSVSSTNNNSLKRKSVSPALIVTDQKAPRTSPPSLSRSSAVNFKPYETVEKKKSGSVVSLSPPLTQSPKSGHSDKRKTPPQHHHHKDHKNDHSKHDHHSFSRLADHTNPAFR